jgi:plastocyanin
MSSMLGAVLLVAIGTVASPGAEAADTVVMHAGSGEFAPRVTTVEVGERVTWVNDSRTEDIFVTAARPVEGHAIAWQTKLEMDAVVHPGSTYTHKFRDPGAYYYYCAGHMDMWGIVIVEE